jgi:hypothetical protein
VRVRNFHPTPSFEGTPRPSSVSALRSSSKCLIVSSMMIRIHAGTSSSLRCLVSCKCPTTGIRSLGQCSRYSRTARSSGDKNNLVEVFLFRLERLVVCVAEASSNTIPMTSRQSRSYIRAARRWCWAPLTCDHGLEFGLKHRRTLKMSRYSASGFAFPGRLALRSQIFRISSAAWLRALRRCGPFLFRAA